MIHISLQFIWNENRSWNQCQHSFHLRTELPLIKSLVVAPCRSIKLSNINTYDTYITPNQYLEWQQILKPMAAQLSPENWAAID